MLRTCFQSWSANTALRGVVINDPAPFTVRNSDFDGYDGDAGWYGGSSKYRAWWELDMAVLVANGYQYGQYIRSGSLVIGNTTVNSLPSNSTNAKAGLALTNIAACSAVAASNNWNAMAGSLLSDVQAISSGTGSKTITLGRTTLDLIMAMPASGASSKRFLALISNDENTAGALRCSQAGTDTVTFEFEQASDKKTPLWMPGGFSRARRS